jgi:hypothetical protein
MPRRADRGENFEKPGFMGSAAPEVLVDGSAQARDVVPQQGFELLEGGDALGQIGAGAVIPGTALALERIAQARENHHSIV